MTAGALWKNEEGNVVSVRQAHALFVVPPNKRSTLEDTSFARSRDPCTSIGTQLRRRKATEVSRRSRYRGRANLRKREEPATGSRSDGRMRGSPRVTAPRGNSRGSCADASEKEGGHGHRPCEETRVPDLSSVRRKQLQKSAGSILASNKHVRSAPKRVAVRVNGGLGGAASGGNTSETTSIEEMSGASALHQTLHGEGPA